MQKLIAAPPSLNPPLAAGGEYSVKAKSEKEAYTTVLRYDTKELAEPPKFREYETEVSKKVVTSD